VQLVGFNKYGYIYVIFIVAIFLDKVFVFKELCCQWSTNLNQLLLTWASWSGVWGLVWVLFDFLSYFSIHMEGESKFTNLMVSFVRKF